MLSLLPMILYVPAFIARTCLSFWLRFTRLRTKTTMTSRIVTAPGLSNAPSASEADSHQAAEYKIYPLAEALFIGLAIFIAIFLTTFFIYVHALDAKKGEIREGLTRTGAVLAEFIDGDLHKTITSRASEDTEAYRKALIPLEKALNADPSIAFVYTGILVDNEVYFILDPTPSGDSDGDGIDDKAHVMDPYPEASEEMLMALRDQEIVTSEEPYTDRWGSFVSGFVPIYDSNNEFVGVLGIDIEAKNYFERLAPIKRATVRASVTGFFIAFLIAALVWFMRNFSREINARRLALMDDYRRVTGSTKRVKPKEYDK